MKKYEVTVTNYLERTYEVYAENEESLGSMSWDAGPDVVKLEQKYNPDCAIKFVKEEEFYTYDLANVDWSWAVIKQEENDENR